MDDPTSVIEYHEFIIDCARYADGLLSEQDVKNKYRFDDDTWARASAKTTRSRPRISLSTSP